MNCWRRFIENLSIVLINGASGAIQGVNGCWTGKDWRAGWQTQRVWWCWCWQGGPVAREAGRLTGISDQIPTESKQWVSSEKTEVDIQQDELAGSKLGHATGHWFLQQIYDGMSGRRKKKANKVLQGTWQIKQTFSLKDQIKFRQIQSYSIQWNRICHNPFRVQFIPTQCSSL